jgi:hypothetical protein
MICEGVTNPSTTVQVIAVSNIKEQQLKFLDIEKHLRFDGEEGELLCVIAIVIASCGVWSNECVVECSQYYV